MDAIATLLEIVNSLSPLAVIALLAIVIFLLVRGKQEVSQQVTTISDNHLHEVADVLQRIEVTLAENFSYIRSKLNGK